MTTTAAATPTIAALIIVSAAIVVFFLARWCRNYLDREHYHRPKGAAGRRGPGPVAGPGDLERMLRDKL
jgi:hypothetical protein